MLCLELFYSVLWDKGAFFAFLWIKAHGFFRDASRFFFYKGLDFSFLLLCAFLSFSFFPFVGCVGFLILRFYTFLVLLPLVISLSFSFFCRKDYRKHGWLS